MNCYKHFDEQRKSCATSDLLYLVFSNVQGFLSLRQLVGEISFRYEQFLMLHVVVFCGRKL